MNNAGLCAAKVLFIINKSYSPRRFAPLFTNKSYSSNVFAFFNHDESRSAKVFVVWDMVYG